MASCINIIRQAVRSFETLPYFIREKIVRDLVRVICKTGDELLYIPPWRVDNNPDSNKFNVAKSRFKDFGQSDKKGGDIVTFISRVRNIKPIEAAQLLNNLMGNIPSELKNGPLPRQYWNDNQIVYLRYIPESFLNEIKHASRFGVKPSMSWLYTNATGKPIYSANRYDFPDRKEVVLHICGMFPSGLVRVFAKNPPGKLVLFNLHRIKKYPELTVYLVEGEKCAETLQTHFDKHNSLYIVTTWHGGTSRTHQTDFSPLYGRHVILWPDADATGFQAMKIIGQELIRNGSKIGKVQIPAGVNKGWDCFDWLQEAEELK